MIERDAPKNEVKARFRELSRQFHPDKQKQNTDNNKSGSAIGTGLYIIATGI